MFRSTLASLVLVLGGFAGGWACPTTDLSQEKAVDETQAEQKQDSEKKAEPEEAESEKAEAQKAESEKQDPASPALEKGAVEKGATEKEAATEKAHDAHAATGRTDAAHAEAGHSEVTGAEHAAGHGKGHHDPLDLSHHNASANITDPSEWKSDLAVSSLIVFLCLLALLTKFAWRPIMDGLQKRELGIAAQIAEAKRSAETAALQLRQYEARLAAATEEARGIVDQARRDAETAKDRILAEAQEVAKRERQRAVDDINAAKNVALQEMTQKSVDIAVSLAGKLIRKQLRPEDHAQLIREMVDQFPSRN